MVVTRVKLPSNFFILKQKCWYAAVLESLNYLETGLQGATRQGPPDKSDIITQTKPQNECNQQNRKETRSLRITYYGLCIWLKPRNETCYNAALPNLVIKTFLWRSHKASYLLLAQQFWTNCRGLLSHIS